MENEDWRKFIRDKKLDWLNLSDFPDANENPTKYLFDQKVTDLKSLNFRKTYDIFSTPQVYLVDKDKKIIGKKLDALTLATMMEHIEDVKIEYKTVLEEQQKKELQNYVKEWLKYDDEIKTLQDAIKERKKQKNEIGKVLINFMDTNNIPHFNLSDGKLIFAKSEHTQPVNIQFLKNIYLF